MSAFTVAHSITLSLAALNLVTPPARIIEPAIALSIVYVGADNLMVRDGRDVRAWIAFAFGFIHGFGFANVLREMDLPRARARLVAVLVQCRRRNRAADRRRRRSRPRWRRCARAAKQPAGGLRSPVRSSSSRRARSGSFNACSFLEGWHETSIVLGGSLAVGSAVADGGGLPGSRAAPKVVEVEKLKDNLFMLKGGGGNTAVFVGSNGITVVDTKNPGWGQPILDKIKELTPKPVTTIINTHTHGDHVSGNVEFPATVDIVVQENTKANMEKMAPVTGIAPPGAPPAPNIFEAEQRQGPAEADVQGQDDARQGRRPDRPVLLRPRPHERRRVGRLPGAARACTRATSSRARTRRSSTRTTAAAASTSATRWPRRADTIKNIDTVITGHSTQMMTMADLRGVRAVQQGLPGIRPRGVQGGKSLDAIAAEYKLPAKYAGYQAAEARVKSNVQVIADELKKK